MVNYTFQHPRSKVTLAHHDGLFPLSTGLKADSLSTDSNSSEGSTANSSDCESGNHCSELDIETLNEERDHKTMRQESTSKAGQEGVVFRTPLQRLLAREGMDWSKQTPKSNQNNPILPS